MARTPDRIADRRRSGKRGTQLRAIVLVACVTFGNASAEPVPPAKGLPSAPLPNQLLVWDAVEKAYEAKAGETKHEFSFVATNAANQEIVIEEIQPSCGCTLTELPSRPWRLKPGASGTARATIDFTGKVGVLTKTLGVRSSVGFQTLILKVIVPTGPANPPRMQGREMNQGIARADRQAVFRPDCATCHAPSALREASAGDALFQGFCAICHEAPHRASMVPDLALNRNHRDVDYWRKWIGEGGEKTLMPAFSRTHGGPLADNQIEALVRFLVTKYPKEISAK